MTKPKKDRYDIEFKRMAVVLANHPDMSNQAVAESLGIHPFMLSRWKKECREGRLMGKRFSREAETELAKANRRIRELEKALKQAELENDLLKKAKRFLSAKKKASDS